MSAITDLSARLREVLGTIPDLFVPSASIPLVDSVQLPAAIVTEGGTLSITPAGTTAAICQREWIVTLLQARADSGYIEQTSNDCADTIALIQTAIIASPRIQLVDSAMPDAVEALSDTGVTLVTYGQTDYVGSEFRLVLSYAINKL